MVDAIMILSTQRKMCLKQELPKIASYYLPPLTGHVLQLYDKMARTIAKLQKDGNLIKEIMFKLLIT